MAKRNIPKLEIQPLTKRSFSSFGTVIETKGAREISINQGTTKRFDAISDVDVGEAGGRPIISMFRANCRPNPIEIHLLERHPLGSQAFIPLSQHDWLVVVAHCNKFGDAPDFSTLVCFKASGDQGVSYARGTWHHPLIILQKAQDFLVIDRQGEGHNLDEVWHEGPAAIVQP